MKLSLATALFLGVNALSHSENELKEDLQAMEEAEDETEMWKVSMNNQKFKEIVKEDKAISRDAETFIRRHPLLRRHLDDLARDLVYEVDDIRYRLKDTIRKMDAPKYEAELNAIGQDLKAFDNKVKINLKFNDEGLKMWSVQMDNKKHDELEADSNQIGEDWQKFVMAHPNLKAELQDLGRDLGHELMQIMARLDRTSRYLYTKHRAAVNKLDKRFMHLDQKIKRNLKFDPETAPVMASIQKCNGEFIGGKRSISGYHEHLLNKMEPTCPGNPILLKEFISPNENPPMGWRAVYVDELQKDYAFKKQVDMYIGAWDIISVVNGWTEGRGYGRQRLYGSKVVVDCGARNVGLTLFVKHECTPFQGINE